VGTVIEAHLSKTQGSIATVIVQNGLLKVGDFVSLGAAFGKVRSLEDENSKQLKQASSSVPVRITGLSALPEVGDLLRVHENVQEAQTSAKKLLLSRSAKRLAYKTGIVADKENQQLKLIVKADTNGSLEAIMQELSKLENQEVALTIVSQGIGDINESDVLSAESASATLIGFHNTILPSAARLAKQKQVHIDIYDIIYELTEDITQAILQLVIPEVEYIVTATAKIMAIFRTERESMIIGGKVTEGKLIADRRLQIWRAGKQLGDGKIAELQSGKLPAREVSQGDEFGMKITTRVALEKNDVIKIVDERMKEKQLKKKAN
jgi:translation initiation factor IF-2